MNVRPMTDKEREMFTQIMDLSRERDEARAWVSFMYHHDKTYNSNAVYAYLKKCGASQVNADPTLENGGVNEDNQKEDR